MVVVVVVVVLHLKLGEMVAHATWNAKGNFRFTWIYKKTRSKFSNFFLVKVTTIQAEHGPKRRRFFSRNHYFEEIGIKKDNTVYFCLLSAYLYTPPGK